ncbi:hypothetical protein IEQ34_002395 [Dendrobium chrysotoxum]|uniref:NAB domain-containing protein n=1 Tax=Dendrobium chrysotoxum TaxID=161865 RepID=A0AAV7HNC4_DENCH|nr:hypothetical protein IEQ34_002395 [Dendrobium chrysotoxum]
MATSKSHSWWWNSYISPRNSKWLSESLQETDRLVNETLKLIEEDGDSFAKKAQMYYQRRPELIAHVGDFYRMYRALAERYDHVISDIAKNIPTELQSQGSVNGSEFGTEATSLSVTSSPDRTSEHKLNYLKPHWKSSSFELFLGNGERYDRSKKGCDESSSESSSYCDNGNVIDDFENSSKLEERIIELEQELCEARDKLHKYKNGHEEQCEYLVNNEHLDLSLTTSSFDNQPVVANKIFMELVKQIERFQADLPDGKEEVENLKNAMEAAANQFKIEISCRNNIIMKYKTWLDEVLKKFGQVNSSPYAKLKSVIAEEKDEAEQISEHKSSLEIRTVEQEDMIKEPKALATQSSNPLLEEKSLLEAKLSRLMASSSSYESKIQFFEERVKQLEAENSKVCTESEKQISELNQNLYKFKMKVDMLTLEKEELNAEVIRLIEDIETWDDESRKIDEQLRELQLEHEKLIQEVEDARKASMELTNRVRELEEEVEMQRGVIIDCAEGKREAIRHLCLSLEHYRDGYQQLRQILRMKFNGLQS